MKHNPDHGYQLSEFLRYLIANASKDDGRIPPLTVLSQELGISVASLREQLEVARAFGLVEAKPRTGIRKLPYSFRPAVQQSLTYAVALDPNSFQLYSELRNRIEAAYWYEAVCLLTPEDHERLRQLIRRAWERLGEKPPQIPHEEHRELHLTIYRRLNNPFVLGLLETYWTLYEIVGLNVYADYDYLQRVWQFHEKMVEAICTGQYEVGYRVFMDHVNLVSKRVRPSLPSQRFE